MNNASSLDILMERVNRLILDVEGLCTDLRTQNSVLQRVPVIEEQIKTLDGKASRCFTVISEVQADAKETSDGLLAVRTTNRVSATLCGLAFTAAIGFTGWAWSQLTTLQNADQSFSIRITTLEIKAQEAEKNADKLTKNGWVRNDK